eukprot:g923.t2
MGARLLELAVRGQRLPRLGSRPVLTGRQRLEQPTAVVEHGAGGDDGARHGFGRGLGKPADPVRHHPGCFGALKLHSSRPPPGTHTCEGQPRPPGGQRLFKEQPFERALCAGEEGQLTLWDLRSSVALCEVKGHEKLIWILRELRLRRHSEAVADSGGHIGRDLSDATEAPGDRGVGRVLPIYYGIHFMVLLSNGQSWSTDFQGSVLMLCTWHGSAPSSNFPAWTVCALLWCWLFAPLPSKLIFWARQSFGHGELYSLTLWSLLVLLGALDEFWHNVFIFTLGLCTCEVALSLPPAKGPYNWFWPVWCDVTLLGFLLLTAKWNYETGLSGLSWGSSFWSGCFAPVAVWSRKIYECDAPRHATLASRFIPLRRAKSGGALPSNAVTVDQLTGRPLVKSSVPEAPRINDARREEVENQFRKLRQSVLIWEVVGGAREGGLVVREGHSLTSTGIRPQLRCGSLVRELADKGERICYQLLQGNGPSAGWVSIKVKKTEMKPSKEGEVQLLIRRLAMLPLPLQKVLNFPVLSCKQITEYIYEPRFFPHDAVLRSMLQDPQLSPVRRCFPGPEGKYMPSMDTWGNVEKDLRTTTLRGAVRFGAQATQSMSRGEPEEDGSLVDESILLQRRSRKVTEPNTYGFLGGGLEPEELHFLKTQGCAQLRKKALLRAALREAAEEGGAGSPTMEPVVLPALVVAKEEVVPSKPIKYQSKSQTKNAHLPSSLLQLLSQSELPPMVTFKGAGVSKNGVKAYTNTFVFHLMEGPEAEWKPRALPEHRVEIDERSPYLGYRWVRLIHSGPAFGAGKLCAWVRALFNQHREEFWSAVQLTKHGLSPTSKLEATVRPASEFAPGVHGGAEAMLLADAAVYFARLTWRSNAMLKKISCQFSKPCPCFETLEISVNLGLEEESAYNFGGLTAKLDKQLISFAEVALVSFPSKPMRLPADLPPRCALAPPGVDWVPAELAQSRLPKVGKATPYTHDEYMAAAFERPRMAWPSSCAAVEEVGREELERQRGRRKHVRANRPVRQEGDMRNDLCFPGGLTPAAISFEKYFEKALDGIRFEGTLKLGPQSTEALFLTPDGQSVAHPGMALAALDDHLAHLPRCDGREKTSITWKLEMEAHGLLPIGQELSFECFCPFAQTGPVGNVASGTIRYEDQILATLSAVITSSDKNAADALQVPDLEDYWGAHRIVTCDAPVFWVNFSLSGNTKRYLDISAGTLHPASSFSSDRLWDLRVDALVLAPGLPQLDPSTLEIDLPAEVGSFGQLLQSPEDVSTCAHRETQLAVQVRQGLCGYFDNFGAWGVWSSVLLDRHVEVSGDGLVAFWLRGGTTGKFWVMLGTAGPEQEERLCFTVRVL